MDEYNFLGNSHLAPLPLFSLTHSSSPSVSYRQGLFCPHLHARYWFSPISCDLSRLKGVNLFDRFPYTWSNAQHHSNPALAYTCCLTNSSNAKEHQLEILIFSISVYLPPLICTYILSRLRPWYLSSYLLAYHFSVITFFNHCFFKFLNYQPSYAVPIIYFNDKILFSTTYLSIPLLSSFK